MSTSIGYPLSLSRSTTHPCEVRLWVVLKPGTNFARFSYRKVT